MQLRVLSFNIHKGFDWKNHNFTLEQVRDAIISVDADIVFLQEVVGENVLHAEKVKGWPTEPTYRFLAGEFWSHHAYAKNAIHEHGDHGNVILSKFPIVNWNQQDISTNRFEQRGILYCNIEIPANYQGNRSPHIIHAYCLHLNLLHGGRKKQYASVMERLKLDVSDPEPTIVAGDFNDWNKKSGDVFEKQLGMQEVHKALYGDYAKTFPVHKPFLALDRIYVQHIQIDNASVLKDEKWRALSDHAALYTELSLSDG